jgi:hypothetical protein
MNMQLKDFLIWIFGIIMYRSIYYIHKDINIGAFEGVNS